MPLQWPQIDRAVGTIRLEPGTVGTTKNQGGRTIAYAEIDELCEVVDERWQAREGLQQRGVICPWVFNRDGRPIKSFRRSWITVLRAGSPAALGVCRMTFDGPRCATWIAPAWAVRWR